MLRPAGLTVETAVQSRPACKLAELVETIPSFLHEGRPKDAKVSIQLQVGDQWREAASRPQANVKAVRIERSHGAVLLALDRPRSVQLAPRDWTDGFQTRATCQTILVDLLESADPKAIESATVAYTLTAAPATQKK